MRATECYWSLLAILVFLSSIGCGRTPIGATGADDPNAPAAPAAKVAGGAAARDDAENAVEDSGAAKKGVPEHASRDDGESNSLPSLWTRKKGVDWPRFLGPTQDSKSPETGIITDWPPAGPRIVWQRELGTSYGICSVAQGRLYQFDRYDELDEQQLQRVSVARLVCLNAETGEELWRFDYPTNYEDLYGYNGGPRCSPVIDDDRVYIYGVEGMLHCVRAADGKAIWKIDTVQDFGVVQNFFGVGSTPVVAGDLLLVMVGGSPPGDQTVPPGQLNRVTGNGTGLVAFDKRSGAVKYQITDELASYSSLKLATIGDRAWGFAFCREGLVGFEPQTGRVDFQYPWRAKILESVNASTPVVVGSQVFISETYGPGSSLLEVRPGNYSVVWNDDPKQRQKAMQAHWNTPIYVDGYLYGCSGRNPPDADLRCIHWKTGEVAWSVPHRYRTSLLYVDGHFVCLGEYGNLQLIKVNPQACEVVAEVVLREKTQNPQPPGLEAPPLLKYPCWAAPILSHGLLYVRGEERLVCLELIP